MERTSLRRHRDICIDYRTEPSLDPPKPSWAQAEWANDPQDVILQKLGGSFAYFRSGHDLLNYFKGRWEQEFGVSYAITGQGIREISAVSRFVATRGMENACRIVKALFDPPLLGRWHSNDSHAMEPISLGILKVDWYMNRVHLLSQEQPVPTGSNVISLADRLVGNSWK